MVLMLFLLLGCCVLWSYMYFLAHHDKVRYHLFRHPNVREAHGKYTIFFIADIHRRVIRKETIQKVETDLDIVCIGGDLLEKGVPLHRVRENIRRLKRFSVPIYFVWGNNDEEMNPMLLRQLLLSEGVTILEDKMMPLWKNGERIWLAGFRYEMYPVSDKPMIPWEETENELTILLTHKPNSFDVLNDAIKKHIDLVLAGHTHGGQIRFFGFGPYKRGGVEKVFHTLQFVTEGYGYSLLPFRLGTRAECHVIQVQS